MRNKSADLCRKKFGAYKCEACGEEIAWSFSFDRAGNCRLTGDCTDETESYYIQFERFFLDPKELVGWITHMMDKGWFRPKSFMDAMGRLSEESQTHNKFKLRDDSKPVRLSDL